MCLHAYLINWKGAEFLLNNIFPVNEPIDIEIVKCFDKFNKKGSYIFNSNMYINDIRPEDYKDKNGRKCMFNGIVFQNHEEQGSTIHQEETVY
jgi:hypothetical protein